MFTCDRRSWFARSTARRRIYSVGEGEMAVHRYDPHFRLRAGCLNCSHLNDVLGETLVYGRSGDGYSKPTSTWSPTPKNIVTTVEVSANSRRSRRTANGRLRTAACREGQKSTTQSCPSVGWQTLTHFRFSFSIFLSFFSSPL